MSNSSIADGATALARGEAATALHACAAARREGAPSGDVDHLEAMAALALGHAERARSRAESALAGKADDPGLWYVYARALRALPDLDAADHAFQQALAKNGPAETIEPALLETQIARGAYAAALARIEAIETRGAATAQIQGLKADLLGLMGRHREAEQTAQDAVQSAPKDPTALRALALSALRSGAYARAVSLANDAVQAQSRAGTALAVGASARFLLGERETGLEMMARAARLAPHRGEVWHNFAYLREANGDRDGAWDAAAEAVRWAPGLSAAWLLRSRLLAPGDLDAAVESARRATVANDRPASRAFSGYVSVLLEAGWYARAEDAVRDGLDRHPGDLRLLRAGIGVSVALGDRDSAIARRAALLAEVADSEEAAYLARDLQRTENRSELADYVARWAQTPARLRELFSFARALGALAPAAGETGLAAGTPAVCERLVAAAFQAAAGKADAAFNRLAKLEVADDQFVDISLLRADLAGEAGRTDVAEVWFRRVLAHAPTNLRAVEGLVDILLTSGRYREATDLVETAVQDAPKQPRFRLLRAICRTTLGRHALAIDDLEDLVRAHPNLAGAWVHLAAAASEIDRVDQAEEALARARELDGETGRVKHAESLFWQRQGRLDRACAAAEAACAQDPDRGSYRVRLAQARAASGDDAGAIALCEAVLALNPADTAARAQLGQSLEALGRSAEAATHREQLARAQADSAAALLNQARTLERSGNLDGALAAARQAAGTPSIAGRAQARMAVIYQKLGQPEAATAAAQRACRSDPDSPDALLALAEVLQKQGHYAHAIRAYRLAIQKAPHLSDAHNKLGLLLNETGRPHLAEGAFVRAKQYAPRGIGGYVNLGNILKDTGRIDAALAEYRKALAIQPNQHVTHTNVLLALQYLDDPDPYEIKRQAEKWDAKFGRPAVQVGTTTPPSDPDGPIRVGYVSGSFRRHPVGWLTLRAIEARPRAQQHVTLFNVGNAPSDKITRRYQKTADAWQDVQGLSGDALARAVRDAGIDVLVDLTGHAKDSRLATFGFRPAPVQVKWVGGQFGTTGMREMDWFLTDPVASPPEADAYHTEKLYRLPDCYVCYGPPGYAPKPGALPARRTGSVTFGCFNNVAKYSARTLALWAEILKAVPDARLMLKTHVLQGSWTANRLRAAFEAHGVARERLDIRAGSGHPELLKTYQEVDIALDPMPYNGGLTTLEALWMGVPVLTRAGVTFCQRHSATHLHAVGLSDWIAESDAAYRDKAVAAAADWARLARLRGELRGMVGRSPLCDAKRFGANLDAAYRQMIAAVR